MGISLEERGSHSTHARSGTSIYARSRARRSLTYSTDQLVEAPYAMSILLTVLDEVELYGTCRCLPFACKSFASDDSWHT